MKIQKVIDWIWENEEIEFQKVKDLVQSEEIAQSLITLLIEQGIWIQTKEKEFMVKETAKIFKNKKTQEIAPLLEKLLKEHESLGTDAKEVACWESLHLYLKKFVVYKGDIILYEMTFGLGNKEGVIRLEGKEIMDYKVFILRFFEEFGTMLPTYKGISLDWSKLMTNLYQHHAEINYDKSEILSPIIEAKELVIDSIEESIVSDEYSLREGIICYKNDTIFVSTKMIKKLLKRNDLHVSMRNLAYLLKDLLISGSIPIKVGNKSERFWRFNPKKLNINLENKLKVMEEEDE
jgi:hypothetical protein